MKKRKARILGTILILAGLVILSHHLYVSGRLFDLEDVLHHEFFEAILFTAALVLLVCSHTREK